MGDRNELTQFWAKHSHAPTVQTMMLCSQAESFDDQDRNDILSSLPDITDMRIVELGAGIGRFTKYLATKAKSVYVTDIIQSFVDKNEELHGHIGNCNFETIPASEIVRDPHSCEMVFTNWLLMYLTDAEVVSFLQNVLNWLTVEGFLHFRESCSESSKRTTANGSASGDANPTHYRHICQYINLLNALSVVDVDGKRFAFKVLWAKSIPTYIEYYSNWRQIEMLIRKIEVVADDVAALGVFNENCLMNVLKDDTLREQQRYDKDLAIGRGLWKARTPLSKTFLKFLRPTTDIKEKKEGVLNIVVDPNFCLSPMEIAEENDCCVVGIETCAYAYNNLLNEVVNNVDKRIRLHWLARVDENENWSLPVGMFDSAVGCCITKCVDNLSQFFANITCYLRNNGQLVLFEQVADDGAELKQMLKHAGFDEIEFHDFTEEAQHVLSKAASVGLANLPRQAAAFDESTKKISKWISIVGRLTSNK